MIAVRSAIFNICFFALTALLLIAGLPTLLAGREALFRVARFWSRSSRWLLHAICGLKVEFRGMENLPKGAFILAAKHQSALETFALAECVEDFSFILKRELTYIPLFGWYLRRAEMIAINRKNGRAAVEQAIERSRALLNEGRTVVIFPEGTRTPPGGSARYKMGVAHIYAATGAACVPAALNTGMFWPRRSFMKYRGTAVIEFLPAIEPGHSPSDFLETLRTRIEDASGRLVAEAVSADASAAGRLTSPGG